MKLNQYLDQPRILREEIHLREDNMKTLSIVARQLDPYRAGMPASMNLESRVERYVIQKEKLEQEIADLQRKLNVYEAELLFLFTMAGDENSIKVLTRHYIGLEKYETIAESMERSISHVFRLRDKGIKDIKPYYEKNKSELIVK